MGKEAEVMTTGVGVYKGTLAEIIGGLNEGQQMFLSLRLRGMGHAEALKVIDRRAETAKGWKRDESFVAIAGWLSKPEVREKYAEEALKIFAGNLSVKAQELLDLLLTKGIERWEELDKADKGYVMQAVNLVAKRPTGLGGGGGSYEELILRRRLEK